jgi:hypothetical protein
MTRSPPSQRNPPSVSSSTTGGTPAAHDTSNAEAALRTMVAEFNAAWSRTERTLMPIIGRYGFGALYARAIHLARRAHGCLADMPDSIHAVDIAAVRRIVAQEDLATATRALDAIPVIFHELLASLIGTTLAANLLDRPGSAAESAPDAPVDRE